MTRNDSRGRGRRARHIARRLCATALAQGRRPARGHAAAGGQRASSGRASAGRRARRRPATRAAAGREPRPRRRFHRAGAQRGLRRLPGARPAPGRRAVPARPPRVPLGVADVAIFQATRALGAGRAGVLRRRRQDRPQVAARRLPLRSASTPRADTGDHARAAALERRSFRGGGRGRGPVPASAPVPDQQGRRIVPSEVREERLVPVRPRGRGWLYALVLARSTANSAAIVARGHRRKPRRLRRALRATSRRPPRGDARRDVAGMAEFQVDILARAPRSPRLRVRPPPGPTAPPAASVRSS